MAAKKKTPKKAAPKTYDLKLYEVISSLADPTAKKGKPRNAAAGEFLYLTDEQASYGVHVGYLKERSLMFAKKGDLTGKLPA